MKQLFLLLFILTSFTLFGATPPDSSKQVAVGHWRTHLTYLSVSQVAETPERVYGVSDGALFSYDKESSSFEVYSKIEGLSDNTITQISYSLENRLLLIIYENSNIDIVTDQGDIYNIPDIKDKNTAIDKTINGITFVGSKAFLSTGYGISIINLAKHEIADSYLLNKNTFSITINNDTLYAATEKGILSASTKTNLVDPSNWATSYDLLASKLMVFKGKVVAFNHLFGLFTLNGSGYDRFFASDQFSDFTVSNNQLVAFGLTQISYFNSFSDVTSVAVENLLGFTSLSPANVSWIATGSTGITKIERKTAEFVKTAIGNPDGPLANSPYRLRFNGSKLMVTGGGAWDDRFFIKGLMMFFENEKWSFQKVDTIQIDPDPNNIVYPSPMDFINCVEDPREAGHYFVTSYGEGVYEFRNKKLVKRHDHTNSIIETHDKLKGSNHFDRTFGLCYDKDNNLFVTNSYTSRPIKVLTKTGDWVALNYPPVAFKESNFDLIQTKKGVMWALSSWDGSGILAFDTKGTITDQTDDQYKFIKSINYLDNLETRTISPENFFCLAEDKNGAIWVGTDMGPIVFNSPTKVFTDNFLGTRIKVPRNDGTMLADYLLENEKISAICVDGGNRKWIGTESNGVYLVSENGQETYAHFTSENSPLFSNKILSIAIHPLTGEVFFGTDKGLVSYRSDAIEGKKDYSNVYAFPNPVRPDYEGYITITGLKTKSTVRITDLNGNNLFEGESVGGQIAWDGKNRLGKRLSSGVYLVYSATSDATDGVVCKILILK